MSQTFTAVRTNPAAGEIDALLAQVVADHTLVWGDSRYKTTDVDRHYRWVCQCGDIPPRNWPHLVNGHLAHVAAMKGEALAECTSSTTTPDATSLILNADLARTPEGIAARAAFIIDPQTLTEVATNPPWSIAA